MTRDEYTALRRLLRAERHLANAYEALHGASGIRPHARAIGNNAAHLADEVRCEINALHNDVGAGPSNRGDGT